MSKSNSNEGIPLTGQAPVPDSTEESNPTPILKAHPVSLKDTTLSSDKEATPAVRKTVATVSKKDITPGMEPPTAERASPAQKMDSTPIVGIAVTPAADKQISPADKGNIPTAKTEVTPTTKKEATPATKKATPATKKEVSPTTKKDVTTAAKEKGISTMKKEITPITAGDTPLSEEIPPIANKEVNPSEEKEANPIAGKEATPSTGKETNSTNAGAASIEKKDTAPILENEGTPTKVEEDDKATAPNNIADTVSTTVHEAAPTADKDMIPAASKEITTGSEKENAKGDAPFSQKRQTSVPHSSKEGKRHVSVVICGHIDAGKSTTIGRLIFELGGIEEPEMTKLKDDAKVLKKDSYVFAFYMNKSEEERARGVTIACNTNQFYTESYHYTVIDAPGHHDFVKNAITGASQADVGILMVPADGTFTDSISDADRKGGKTEGQTRQHARLLSVLGVKQIIVCVNKMDCDTAKYGEERFNEVKEAVVSMLKKVMDSYNADTPVIPLSGWTGDNLVAKSDNMKWWTGCDVVVNQKPVRIHTLLDALEKVEIPQRPATGNLRMPISGIYKIRNTGDIITGRIEQGCVNLGDEVRFLQRHKAAKGCTGKVLSIQMHHKDMKTAVAGDNVGLNIEGLDKDGMPRFGDVMIMGKDDSLQGCKTFTAQVNVVSHPGQLKKGYSPVAYVRTGRSAANIVKISWKLGGKTGSEKIEDPEFIKSNDVAEVVFKPLLPFVVETYKDCEGYGRVIFMEGKTVVMHGKVHAVDFAK